MLSKNKKIMLSYNSLNQHTLIIGQSGVGKSVLLKRIYTQLKQQNTGVFVVHDIKGDFIQQFYNPKTDYILNPLDSRSINLNIFKLIKTKADVKAVVAALIPESKEAKEPIWVNSARDIFESIIYLAIYNYKADKIEKLDNLVIKDYIQQGIAFLVENFEKVKECSRGYAHLQAYKTSSQPANIFSNFLSYMTLFDVVAENKNPELDLKEFIEKQNNGATIFLANYNNIKDFVAPLLSLFVNALVRELLSLEENLDRRMFLFLDELTNLLKIDKVLDFLTLARSKGGAAFLGFQDVKALERIYDKEGSETIIANTANKIILRVGDVSTAEYLSKLIGEQEVKIVNKSHSVSPFDRDSVSYSTQIQRRPAVLASQITSLPTLHYFLKTLELQEWTYVPNAFIPAQDKHELKQPKLQLVDTFNINFSSQEIAADFQKMLNMAEEEADEDEQTLL